MAEVGFVGLGAMGSAVAGRLVEAGHRVTVWNRSPAAAEPLRARGAVVAERAEQALALPVSFSMLADDDAVGAVLTADALAAGGPGRVHVCLSSISPTASERLGATCARAEVGYLAAPVLGRPPVAAAGGLNVVAGGPADVLDRVADLLEVIGTRTWHISTEPRTAHVVKIAVNYGIVHAIQSLAETTALVEAHGVPAPDFVELLTGTMFGGLAHRTYGDLIARRAYRPAGFTVPLGAKDLRLVRAAAAERGVDLPSLDVLAKLFAAALERPGADQDDWASVAEVTRSRTTPVPEEDPR